MMVVAPTHKRTQLQIFHSQTQSQNTRIYGKIKLKENLPHARYSIFSVNQTKLRVFIVNRNKHLILNRRNEEKVSVGETIFFTFFVL